MSFSRCFGAPEKLNFKDVKNKLIFLKIFLKNYAIRFINCVHQFVLFTRIILILRSFIMLRKSRLYFTVMCAALVLMSLLITSNARACEDPPQTLLSLYMSSDLVVLAKYESDGESKKSYEDEYGYTLETERNLSLSKIFKGQNDLKSVAFVYSQYESKPQPNAETTSEAETEEFDQHDVENYFDLSKIKIGDEYLFFLKKDAETGKYNVTDYVSGVRDAGKNLSFYEKNFGELEAISAAKKENQHALLTEWIVKNVENAETREDAIRDLSESFYGLSAEADDPIYSQAGPFVVNEGYGIYTVGVAKHLTPAQKARISAALYPMLQTAWFAETPQYADYGISAILGGINKTQLVVYAYNSLQSVGKDDGERRNIIMGFLVDTINDETFSKIYYDYSDIETKIGEAKNADTPEAKKQLKALTAQKDALLKDFDKRFKLLHGRNFAPVEVAKA